MTKNAIIFDTDIGTDIDDVLALIVLIKNNKNSDISVVTTNGPTLIRAKIALTLLDLLKMSSIPVFVGRSASLSNTIAFTHGKEADLAITNREPHSLRNLHAWCQKHPKRSITIISTGPLTTVAWLVKQRNLKQKIEKIVWMGGLKPGSDIPVLEHNLQTDLVSTRIVLKSKIPIFVVPLSTTINHTLSSKEINNFKTSQTSLGKLTWLGMNNWLNITKQFSGKDLIFRNKVFLHDPITVISALRIKNIPWIKSKININNDGIITSPGQHLVNICTGFPKPLIRIIKQNLLSITK